VPHHLAIVTAQYVEPILTGRKSVECRLSKTAVAPFGLITPGQRIYFKQSAGPFFATAIADRVWMTDNLDPAGVDRLREQFDKQILGGDYWQLKRSVVRFGTLIWLRQVEPWTTRVSYRPQNMRAWYVLEGDGPYLPLPPRERAGVRVKPAAHKDGASTSQSSPSPSLSLEGRGARRDASGVFDVILTAGCLRHHHVRLGEAVAHFPIDSLGGAKKADAGRPITLVLDGGPQIETDIVAGQKMLRWRGWAEWFAACGLQAGDRLRFTARGRRIFTITAVRGKS
jgi:hypothetical protein